jgi:hypothetical protein
LTNCAGKCKLLTVLSILIAVLKRLLASLEPLQPVLLVALQRNL